MTVEDGTVVSIAAHGLRFSHRRQRVSLLSGRVRRVSFATAFDKDMPLCLGSANGLGNVTHD